MSEIHFFSEDVEFSLKHRNRIIHWIKKVISIESNKKISTINYIFCSDAFLKHINIQHLKHNTLTDIITFNNSDDPNVIDSDIYISIERVVENSQTYKVSIDDELHRVMIHGILHLVGYSDASVTEQEIMRKKENECLTLLKN